MIRTIQIVFAIILTSFYLFPFEFTFLPGVNTKMAMAGVGLVVLGFQLGRARNSIFSKDMVTISAYAMLVSLIGFCAVAYNETRDYSYATYVISMWVWLSAAYATIMYIRKVHGYVTLELVCNYLIAVCILQCISAMLIQYIPFVKNIVNEYIGTMSGMGRGSASALDNRGRLYGIGAALDIAGSRFAAIMVIIMYLSRKVQFNNSSRKVWIYCFSFIIIGLIGNMISRTTTVGILLALLFLVFDLIMKIGTQSNTSIFRPLLIIGSIGIIIILYLYSHNALFYDNIRFAFEGFFSLFEHGEWSTNSTDILESMYRFPTTTKTWLIGDGYMTNPSRTDPYYVGFPWKGFYMGTDVGYLRFIYYFGLIGLYAFSTFMYKVTTICIKRHPQYNYLFWWILLLNFIIWLKVSTDIFLILALFLVISKEENDEHEKSII